MLIMPKSDYWIVQGGGINACSKAMDSTYPYLLGDTLFSGWTGEAATP